VHYARDSLYLTFPMIQKLTNCFCGPVILNVSFICAAALAQGQQRPRILGVAHISLYAQNFEASRSFYGKFLGFEEPYSLNNTDGSVSMTFFKINDKQYIELSPEREPHSDRLNHFAIETDNAEAMRAYLAQKGVHVPDHVPKGRIGNLNFMIKDPEGRNVEVVQYPPDSLTARAFGKNMPDTRISKRMMHVGFVVTKFDAEMKFYTEVLGFREIWRGSSNGKVLSWINLKVPDGEDYIELMLYSDAPSPERRGTANHLCLEVSDVAASVAALNASPYRKLYSRPIEIKTGVNRKRQANLFDPDGTRTELMEPHTIDGKPAPSSDAPIPPQHNK
jgi:catechol 2,3-dioxygenase-like lactoylglutathione lyase family enzyme